MGFRMRLYLYPFGLILNVCRILENPGFMTLNKKGDRWMGDHKSKTDEINKDRLLAEFVKLVSFDSESFHEKGIAEYLKEKLRSLGLRVEEDHARERLLENGHLDFADKEKLTSNIYAYLEGNTKGSPILFSSHMDTVRPGTGKKAVLGEDGTITSDGNTVLGADDISGLVSILEALTVIREKQLAHPDIEILFTVAEEPYCEGSRYIEYERLKAKEGYVLDLNGAVGRAAVAAPSILSIKVRVKGKAAHAGFAPERGINAMSIAADALSHIRTGRVYENLTVNFGTIHGGSGRNIVPESIEIEGEVRCLEHERALCETELIKGIFEKAAKKYGGSIEFIVTEHIHSYKVLDHKNVIQRFHQVVSRELPKTTAQFITTYGGSDANRLNEHGIETIVLACAMENSHETTEYTNVRELEKSARLTLGLMTWGTGDFHQINQKET